MNFWIEWIRLFNLLVEQKDGQFFIEPSNFSDYYSPDFFEGGGAGVPTGAATGLKSYNKFRGDLEVTFDLKKEKIEITNFKEKIKKLDDDFVEALVQESSKTKEEVKGELETLRSKSLLTKFFETTGAAALINKVNELSNKEFDRIPDENFKRFGY